MHLSCRSLLVWQDERISFVQQGVSVWTRDEALGGVTTALFSDLPPGKKAAAGVESQVRALCEPQCA